MNTIIMIAALIGSLALAIHAFNALENFALGIMMILIFLVLLPLTILEMFGDWADLHSSFSTPRGRRRR